MGWGEASAHNSQHATIHVYGQKNIFERQIKMKNKNSYATPRWLFAVIAIGAFIAMGIYIGIMSVEGATNNHLIKVSAFGIVGILMFWGAYAKR